MCRKWEDKNYRTNSWRDMGRNKKIYLIVII